MGSADGTNGHGFGWACQGDPRNGLCSQRVGREMILPRSICRPEPTQLTRCRYQVATGSGDDTVRIWDLRALKTQYIIPAHKSSVSDLKFFRSSGEMPHIPLDLSNGVAPNGGAHANGASNGDVDMDSSEGTNPEPSSVASAEPTLPKSGLFLVTAGFTATSGYGAPTSGASSGTSPRTPAR